MIQCHMLSSEESDEQPPVKEEVSGRGEEKATGYFVPIC